MGRLFVGASSFAAVEEAFSFAFQPIVDASQRKVISFEALVRGPSGEPAARVFARVPRAELHGFDQACRIKALRLAARLKLDASLNLNFLPNSPGRSREYLCATLEASREVGIPPERLVFEITEAEYLQHGRRVGRLFEGYADYGFRTAIDDFGAGFSGLRRLAEYQPNYIKLDRALIADIHGDRVRQVIVMGICGICRGLGITVVAEGVETASEYRWLRNAGIDIFQGYYFAFPSFEALARVPAFRF